MGVFIEPRTGVGRTKATGECDLRLGGFLQSIKKDQDQNELLSHHWENDRGAEKP